VKKVFFCLLVVLCFLVVGCAQRQSIPWATLAKEEAGVRSVSEISDEQIVDVCWKIVKNRVRIQPNNPDRFSRGYALIEAKNECLRDVSLAKVMKE
jgi:hypothetical protein